MTSPEITIPTPIPTDPYELAEVLRGLPRRQHDNLRARLIAQLGGEDAGWHLYGHAHSILCAEDEIDQRRADLHNALADADTQLGRALGALKTLTSNEVYDVEYAEGGTAPGDMFACLSDAARMVRLAIAINPCPVPSPASVAAPGEARA